ncbi:MAG TPA: GNAT family N-acetyltransferase [Vicinamibacterales bacterium]|nr:GNAT family N-acetyltransferase [Vicinamibacterales bacterium]
MSEARGAQALQYRRATVADVPRMARSRESDATAGPADPRMAAYLDGRHHPRLALEPRVAYVALEGDAVVGYIAGHLTTRYDCDGELQYLFVAREHRRQGVASALLRLLRGWFGEHHAVRICVDVEPGNVAGRAFYAANGATPLNSGWLVFTEAER